MCEDNGYFVVLIHLEESGEIPNDEVRKSTKMLVFQSKSAHSTSNCSTFILV